MKGIALWLSLMGAHTGYQAATDGVSSVQALGRPGTTEANPRGVWGAVVLDGVTLGSADYLTGRIKGRKTRLITQNLVRAGSLYLGYRLMQHNRGVGGPLPLGGGVEGGTR